MAYYSDSHLRTVLTETRTIAMVGVSPNPVRPSNFVARYLGMRGYDVIPVNPRAAGQLLYGTPILSALSEITVPVDMVDIFRRPEDVPGIVDLAMTHLTGLRTIWMQIGVHHAHAARRAQQAGLTVIQDRCPKIEHQRLFGELRKGGFVTGVISSRL